MSERTGEEPERLRALAEQVGAGFRHSRRDDHHRLCATKADEGCDCYARFSIPSHQALDALLAEVERLGQLDEAQEWERAELWRRKTNDLAGEVERLARDNENTEEVYKRQLTEVVADRAKYRGEVERLAGERDGWKIETKHAWESFNKERAECERLAGERDDWIAKYERVVKLADESETSRMKSEAERERLAGRVAALKVSLRTLVDAAGREENIGTETWEAWDEATRLLADVGGSE